MIFRVSESFFYREFKKLHVSGRVSGDVNRVAIVFLILFQFLMAKLDSMEKKQMPSLFDFYETLEVITNGDHELAQNASYAQRVTHKDAKKKDCKVALCIQFAVDMMNFDRIFHIESVKEAWNILVKYYEGGEKVKVVKLQTLRRHYELL